MKIWVTVDSEEYTLCRFVKATEQKEADDAIEIPLALYEEIRAAERAYIAVLNKAEKFLDSEYFLNEDLAYEGAGIL